MPQRKVCLLTGAGRAGSIAHGIARGLAESGWDLGLVTLLAYDREVFGTPSGELSELVTELRERGAEVHSHSIDSSILDTTPEAFDRHFAVNARAAWLLIRAFANQVGPSGGAVVALTSDHVIHNLPYGASKGALDRIVVAAAGELGHLGIRANSVNPGPIDTGWMDDGIRASGLARQPTGRLGTPADIARLVRFLVSEDGSWVTGQLIKSDGGFSL